MRHNKQKLHKVGYFRELLSSKGEVHESIRPLLRLSRDTIVRLQKTEYALVSSLPRDPLLAERIKRLRTIPGVGPITALTWALEIGDVTRFRSIKQAISYCGLCSDEKSSADKVMRTPLSKQRNKHIQRALVEAAKLAPRQDHELALVYEKEKEKGHANRATLAVTCKMVAYLVAVDRPEPFRSFAEPRILPTSTCVNRQLEICNPLGAVSRRSNPPSDSCRRNERNLRALSDLAEAGKAAVRTCGRPSVRMVRVRYLEWLTLLRSRCRAVSGSFFPACLCPRRP